MTPRPPSTRTPRVVSHRKPHAGSMLLLHMLGMLWCGAVACRSQPPPSPAEDGPRPTAQAERPGASAAEPAATSGSAREKRTGLASFIAEKFEGRKTASGEPYHGNALVAAHPTYPMGTVLRVTNEENGRSVEVKVIDRSAAGARRPIVDLSRAAAERLDMIRRGTVRVTTEVIELPNGTSK